MNTVVFIEKNDFFLRLKLLGDLFMNNKWLIC